MSTKPEENLEDPEDDLAGQEAVKNFWECDLGVYEVPELLEYDKIVLIAPESYREDIKDREVVEKAEMPGLGYEAVSADFYEEEGDGFNQLEEILEGFDKTAVVFLGMKTDRERFPSVLDVGEEEDYDPVYWDMTDRMVEDCGADIVMDSLSHEGVVIPPYQSAERETLGGGYLQFSQNSP